MAVLIGAIIFGVIFGSIALVFIIGGVDTKHKVWGGGYHPFGWGIALWRYLP